MVLVQDFVKLVEQLEDACIRFVHFSKENELRSRVGTQSPLEELHGIVAAAMLLPLLC